MGAMKNKQQELADRLLGELTCLAGDCPVDELSIADILDSLACGGMGLKKNILRNTASIAYMNLLKEGLNAN